MRKAFTRVQYAASKEDEPLDARQCGSSACDCEDGREGCCEGHPVPMCEAHWELRIEVDSSACAVSNLPEEGLV